jgi:hypothetical protein
VFGRVRKIRAPGSTESLAGYEERSAVEWCGSRRSMLPQKGTVRLGPWRIAQAALYHGRAVKIVGVLKVTTGLLA